jgi:PncC family amidohydrolase
MHQQQNNPSTNELKLYHILSSRNQTVSLAESCTGGMVSSKIINVPGASSIIMEAFITYSNEAKINRLGVSKETLNSFGAVSHECVKEMAINLQKLTSCDLSISVSGIAGPSGGNTDKPIGTVWFGYWYQNHVYTFTKNFDGDRFTIREQASHYAIAKAIEILESHSMDV